MKQPIMLKLLISYIIFAFTGFGIIITITTTLSYRYFQTAEEKTMYQTANRIANEYDVNKFNSITDYTRIKSTLSNMAPTDDYIWILDMNANLVYTSDTSKNAITKGAIESFNIEDFNGNVSTKNKFNTYFDDEMLTVICSVTDNEKYNTCGYILIHKPTSSITQKSSRIIDLTIVTGIILLILSFLPMFIVIIFVYKPLRKINAAAKEFAKGNFKVNSIEVNSHDELAELASSLNTMASQLAEREEYQRKFISNVSHDFRSPLTSIKGYIEAMLDGTIPNEKYEKYLNVVLTETNRLTKLAAGLIDLSAVDSDDIVLFQTVFDLNSIIFDTVSLFEVQCQKKGVLIDLDFDSEIYEVYADKDKISQVFSNLIDNAIKFSDNDSIIYVHVYDKGAKVYVSVKDTGVGIAEDSIGRIFDRFYKSDTSRGRVKNSSGIGLSIVKEIVQAHGENIEVYSELHKGTEFIFSVPKKGANVK